jgi:hypothetical protein
VCAERKKRGKRERSEKQTHEMPVAGLAAKQKVRYLLAFPDVSANSYVFPLFYIATSLNQVDQQLPAHHKGAGQHNSITTVFRQPHRRHSPRKEAQQEQGVGRSRTGTSRELRRRRLERPGPVQGKAFFLLSTHAHPSCCGIRSCPTSTMRLQGSSPRRSALALSSTR